MRAPSRRAGRWRPRRVRTAPRTRARRRACRRRRKSRSCPARAPRRRRRRRYPGRCRGIRRRSPWPSSAGWPAEAPRCACGATRATAGCRCRRARRPSVRGRSTPNAWRRPRSCRSARRKSCSARRGSHRAHRGCAGRRRRRRSDARPRRRTRRGNRRPRRRPRPRHRVCRSASMPRPSFPCRGPHVRRARAGFSDRAGCLRPGRPSPAPIP
ncbi:hypothetical protein PNO31109_00986 [Pandoraea nosoerga]|uniref:Uncharacterized protein n=1 Tax=Pandoraea nosoerga TaxID=2508296 RepID=A0A5E4SUT4_9BURK|nr:hypothetical protein PNO31109_00986 [Pandoraea nosoerga]